MLFSAKLVASQVYCETSRVENIHFTFSVCTSLIGRRLDVGYSSWVWLLKHHLIPQLELDMLSAVARIKVNIRLQSLMSQD